MNNYSLTKQEPLVIYGGGQIGISITQRLISAGYNVTAILDQNPSGVKNSPVIAMTAEDYFKKKGKSFVFIALANGLEHLNVAMRLKIIGYEKIFFLPLILQSKAALAMINSWNDFFAENYTVLIPYYNLLWNVSSDDFVIYEYCSEFVIVNIYKDHIFSGGLEFNKHPFSSYYIKKNTDNISIIENMPLNNNLIEEWINKYRPFSSKLLNFFENTLYCSNNFYFTFASLAIYNNKGYFNIIDGHHRTLFMLDKGFKYLPLRIKKYEWELYFKESKAQALMDYYNNRGMKSLPFEVIHPAFSRFPVNKNKPDDEFINLYKELLLNDLGL